VVDSATPGSLFAFAIPRQRELKALAHPQYEDILRDEPCSKLPQEQHRGFARGVYESNPAQVDHKFSFRLTRRHQHPDTLCIIAGKSAFQRQNQTFVGIVHFCA
jgi:hypothetical protein